jgi:long-chain acyl-CoA synthetase
MSFFPQFSSLIDIYDQSIKSFGHRELFGTKRGGSWQWTTYAEFGKQVDAFRGGLVSLGIEAGDNIAIIANNRVEWAVAAYAAYGLGAAFVPMYEAQNPKEWEFIVHDCGAKALIVANQPILEKAHAIFDKVPALKHMISLADSTNGVGGGDARITTYTALVTSGKTAPVRKPAPSDLAALIYTSGTTGNPKGVMLTHENLASNVSAAHQVFPMEQADRSLSFLPWAHSFGQTCELHALFSAGASMAIAESVDKILDNLAEVHPTLLFSVPRIFNKIYGAVQKTIASKPKPIQEMVKMALKITAKERGYGITHHERLKLPELALLELVDKLVFSKVRDRFGGKLKYAFSGGAAISREVAEFIDSLGIVVYEGYGLTETSPIATSNVPGERRIGSVGRAIPGVRVEIDASTGERKPAENGKPARLEGEIVVYGHNVMKGYFHRDEENALAFNKEGGFRTGDMGYLDSLGYLYITGRIKEQYKLENGKYVVPTPLEEAIKLSPFVANVMVYGDNRPFNIALVVPNMDALKDWAQTNGVSASGDALLSNGAVRGLFKKQIEEHSSAFKGFEGVRDFALIAEDFTTDNNMLTPSLKLKRREVVKVYGKLIDELYAKRPDKKPQATASA